MPQEWNNTIVVTASEVLPWYGSMENLKKAITRDRNKSRGLRKVQLGGNGRELLISFDSLPIEIQNTLGDPRKLLHVLEMFYRFDENAVAFYQNYQFTDGTYLSTAHQEQYITNASVLGALVKLKERRIRERMAKNGSMKGLMKSVLNDAITFNPVLKKRWHTEHSLPTSEKRFKPVLNLFQKEGYASLISKKHRNENAKKMDDEIIALLNSMFATQLHKPTRTEVSKQYDAFLGGYLQIINNSTGELYDPKEFKPLSDATIINWLARWQHRIATFTARGGDRQKLIQQFRPAASLKQPKFVGSMISIDDRQPPFTYGGNKRVWFYNGIDLASECFTCFVYGPTKEGLIVDFYRDMVRKYHNWQMPLPLELEAEMSLNSAYLHTLLRDGNMFARCKIEANNARGKRIEGYYRPLRYELEKKRAGWLARPFAIQESNQAACEKSEVLGYDTIINNCLDDIETWNNMPHSKHPEMSRFDYFMKGARNPDLRPTNYKGILPYIGYRTQTTCNAGRIRMNESWFLLGDKGVLATGEQLINLMSRVEDNDLIIYWLDDGKGAVIKALVYINDTYVCEAIPQPQFNRSFFEQTPEDKKNIGLMHAYTTCIAEYGKSAKARLEGLVIIDDRIITVNNNFKIDRNFEKPTVTTSSSDVEVLPPMDDDFGMDDFTGTTDLKDRF